VFVALAHIARVHGVPGHYALELVEGLGMDVRRERYWTPEELGLYCYRVAGTVGLMMVHVMGVSHQRALRHAADLGIAMQMTNIARDILEDAALGRIYLPLLWLDEAGIPEAQLTQGRYRDALARVVGRLLDEADRRYRSGNEGLRYLPLRASVAVAVASSVYARIGGLVRSRRSHAWDERAVVSPLGKLAAVFRGLALVARTIPYRIFHHFRPVNITTIWRHTWTGTLPDPSSRI
jgi:phytoene synthase